MVHQEEQEALYHHIRGVLPDGCLLVSVRGLRDATYQHQIESHLQAYEDIPKLKRVTACVSQGNIELSATIAKCLSVQHAIRNTEDVPRGR